MDVNAEVNVGLKYTVQQAKFSFPPKESGGVFELGNTRTLFRLTILLHQPN
jgi:hypothetical protein